MPRARVICASTTSSRPHRQSGADAVHPGYGFLAENEDFAAACRDAGVTFIGPTPEAIALMGSKTAARQVAMRAGVAVVPGTEQPLDDAVSDADVVAVAERIGYPIMLKAVAGGGGKGMRMVATPAELPGALRAARSEAASAFGDSAVYLERRIMQARVISRCSSSVMRMAPSCRLSNASAPSSGGTKRSSRRVRRRSSHRSCAGASPRRPPPSLARSTTPTPARSSSCSTKAASSSSSR